MNKSIFYSLALATVMNINCFEGPAGPTGPAGQNGVDYIESVKINSQNKLKINATANWINSKIHVLMGDRILLKASGKLNLGYQEFDPNGMNALAGSSDPVPLQNAYALYFKIGESEIIKTGKSYYGYASDSGEIKFVINTGNVLADSIGYFTIDSLVIYSKM